MIIRSVAQRAARPATRRVVPLCRRAMLSTDTTTTTTTTAIETETSGGVASAEVATTAATTTTGLPRVAWGQRRRAGGQPDTVVEDFLTMTQLQRKTLRLGSAVERSYVPGDLIRDPPAPRDVTLELLMASQTHIGHNKARWNPDNARYLLGVRHGIHVIALEQTAAHLRRAARVLEEVVYRAGLVLFVGTRRGQRDIVVRAAELSGGCHLYSKWTPGAITNRDQILRKSPVRMVDELDQVRPGGDALLPDMRPLTPDLVVVLNPLENFVVLHECAMASIPTIGIIDTDADATRVTYPVPANDDSLRSVGVIAGVLARAGEMGKKRRLRDAAAGKVSWQVPADVARLLGREPAEDSSSSSKGPARVTSIRGVIADKWMIKIGNQF